MGDDMGFWSGLALGIVIGALTGFAIPFLLIKYGIILIGNII
ncbi:MAG: hypothetical protein PVI03_04200 [Candidatus Thorarchaeota archaeon]